MIGRLRHRLSYASVMATIAVFVALGGSSYAAVKITGKDVRDNSLTGADVRNNSLKSADVRNGSLLSSDFKAGELPSGVQGAPGPRGEQGPAGPPGEKGPKGDAGTVDTSSLYTKPQSDARFLAAAAKATDADKLDGLDSSEFAHAAGYASAAGSFSFAGAHDCSTLSGALDGPSVTVDVGPSGLVAIWAEAQFLDFGANEGRVQLFESTDLASCPTILRGNAGTNGVAEVKRTLPGTDAGTVGLGSVHVVRVTPGRRTFSLRYGAVGNAGFTAIIGNRRLAAQPL